MKKKLRLVFIAISALLFSTPNFAQDSNTSNKDEQIAFKKFYNTTDIGILVGSSKNNLKAPFSFMSVTGYHINEQFAIGVGVGADFLEETYIPLVIDLRYYFRKGHFSPFVFLEGGYAFATEKEVDAPSNPILWNSFSFWTSNYPPTAKPKGGFLINPGLGIRKMFSPDFGITFSVSYRFQRLDYKIEDDIRIEADYNRMNFRIGIIFK